MPSLPLPHLIPSPLLVSPPTGVKKQPHPALKACKRKAYDLLMVSSFVASSKFVNTEKELSYLQWWDRGEYYRIEDPIYKMLEICSSLFGFYAFLLHIILCGTLGLSKSRRQKTGRAVCQPSSGGQRVAPSLIKGEPFQQGRQCRRLYIKTLYAAVSRERA